VVSGFGNYFFVENLHNVFIWFFFSIAHEGKVIVAGFASRQIPNVPTSLLLPQSFALIGVSLSHYRDANNEVYRYVKYSVPLAILQLIN